MTAMTRDDIEARLEKVIDPHTDVDLVTGKNIDDISIDGDKVTIDVVLGYPAKSFEKEMVDLVREQIPDADQCF